MDYDLRKLQSVILYIAKEIKRICDANNIKYSMIGGTLIGAVRHKGFIPWDDDLDFVMTRTEYNRFIKCCETQLSEDFFLQNWHTDPYFGHGFTKILLNDTMAIECGKENSLCKQMIFVDIFPFDKIPDSESLRKKQKLNTFLARKMIWLKNGGDYKRFTGKKWFAYGILKCGSVFFTKKALISRFEKYATQYIGDNVKCYTNMTGSYGYHREIIPKALFDVYIEIPFENTMMMAMQNYDYYLRQVFGNYMQLPPVEQRVNHGMKLVDFGDFFMRHSDELLSQKGEE